jgi:pimeloyl-ACP methyl ester carboxylesterase
LQALREVKRHAGPELIGAPMSSRKVAGSTQPTPTSPPTTAPGWPCTERVQAGSEDEDDWRAVSAFMYGRWDDETRAYEAWMDARRHEEAATAYAAAGAFDPEATRAALSTLTVPVLVLAGGCDTGNPPPVMAQVAAIFRFGELVVQESGGHFPWVDDPAAFLSLVAPFLR